MFSINAFLNDYFHETIYRKEFAMPTFSNTFMRIGQIKVFQGQNYDFMTA